MQLEHPGYVLRAALHDTTVDIQPDGAVCQRQLVLGFADEICLQNRSVRDKNDLEGVSSPYRRR